MKIVSGILIIGIIIFAWYSGLINLFISDYSTMPIYRGAYVYDEAERVAFTEYWLTEIIDNHHKLGAMLWIPNSDNTGGFVEIRYYEYKDHWWEIYK